MNLDILVAELLPALPGKPGLECIDGSYISLQLLHGLEDQNIYQLNPGRNYIDQPNSAKSIDYDLDRQESIKVLLRRSSWRPGSWLESDQVNSRLLGWSIEVRSFRLAPLQASTIQTRRT